MGIRGSCTHLLRIKASRLDISSADPQKQRPEHPPAHLLPPQQAGQVMNHHRSQSSTRRRSASRVTHPGRAEGLEKTCCSSFSSLVGFKREEVSKRPLEHTFMQEETSQPKEDKTEQETVVDVSVWPRLSRPHHTTLPLKHTQQQALPWGN